MCLDSSSTKPLQVPYLSSSAKFLHQSIARRTFMKTLIGLAIIGVEGELVACSSETISSPSIPAGLKLLTYNGHSDFVFAAVWSPQSQYIASGGADQTVQVWNAVDGALQSTYQHQAIVTAIAWSPDGNYVASGGDNNTVYIWDTTSPSAKPVSKYNGGGHLWGLAWSADGKSLALGVGSNRHTIIIYDTSNKTLKLICNTVTANVWNIAWSPDGRYIAAACQNNTVQVFDVEANGYNNLTFSLHKDLVWGVDWSPDGRYIASGGFDNKVFVWEARDGSVVFSGEHSDVIYGVAWSLDGAYVTSASRDGLVKVWDVGKRSNVAYYNGHSGSVFRNAWSPEGKRIVSAHRDGTVQVWELPF